MNVKIETEAVWEKERYGVGSVIDVPAEVFELNSSWMKATNEKPNKVEPAKDKPEKPKA